MNKKYVKGIQKWKKAHLVIKSKTATWIYHSLTEFKTMSLIFKEQWQKELEEVKNNKLIKTPR